MANKKTERELDVLQAENDEGEPIADADVLTRGRAPMLVKFRAAGQTHKVELVMSQISYEQRQAPGDQMRRRLVELGVTGQEDVTEDPDALAKVEAAERDVFRDPERLRLRAELAVAAIARDEAGLFRISLPQFREGLTAQKLIDDTIFGRQVINGINTEIELFFAA